MLKSHGPPLEAELSIPAALDHRLAQTVLQMVRVANPDEPIAEAAAALDDVVVAVVDALLGQGASGHDVMEAVQDAFAALLAASRDPSRRALVRTLDSHARAVAVRRLGEETEVA